MQFVILLALASVVLIPGAFSRLPVHCHNGGQSLLTKSTHVIHIFSYTREDSDLRQPRECWWQMTIVLNAVALLEMQHEKRPVTLGDAMPYIIIFQTRNGTNVTEFRWNATNMTHIYVRRGDILNIRLLVDNATAAKMDNNLYLRMSLINTNGTCSDDGTIFCDNNDAFFYTVRNASFICGAQLNNCVLMDKHAAQFNSIGDLQRFARWAANSTGEVGKELRKSTVLIRNRFHNGALMYQDTLCQWVPIGEANVSLQWEMTNNRSEGPYVALQVSADGGFTLRKLSHDAALKKGVLLHFESRPKNAHAKGGGCKASTNWPPPVEGDGGAGVMPNAPNNVVVIVVVVIVAALSIGSIAVYRCVRWQQARRQSNNYASQGANAFEEEGGPLNSDHGQKSNGQSHETHIG